MSDAGLISLAEAAGVAPHWFDFRNRRQDVAPDSLRRVLAALDLSAETDGAVRDSLALLEEQKRTLPPLLTAVVDEPVALPQSGRYEILLEDGGRLEGTSDGVLPGISTPGYHHLTIGQDLVTLAVAPRTCFRVTEAAGAERSWALAVQMYSLRRPGDAGIGDFRALSDLVRSAARHGAAGVAISPVHAQFSADPDRFSPYSPSSRVMLNVLHAPMDWPEHPELESADLVEWPAASRHRLSALRAAFVGADRAALARYRAELGDVLETHARFEALHAHMFGRDPGRWHWRTWPEEYRDPASPAVARFAAEHAEEVALHAWMQMVAAQGMAEAQAVARQAGMGIGLISDLAVGADSGGSHCWSRQAETLLGLTIGAPPDLLSTHGQSWGLAAFSPRGLRQHGFAAYIEMLRSAMRHAGGVRIDHALGLRRMWVVPDGASAAEGAYLAFPQTDLLRLIALESTRNRAVVLGEDLGTIPAGFQDEMAEHAVLGMRVLWFERAQDDRFTSPRIWSEQAAAMSSTHDLATVAGWWSGRDLEWRDRLDLAGGPDGMASEYRDRDRDREALWSSFCASGAAEGAQPSSDATGIVVDAAARHIGGSACELAIVPIEDALGLIEQPNLPGTMDHQHPNWRRRLPAAASEVLELPGVAERLAEVTRARTIG